jgi:hypothetical protein
MPASDSPGSIRSTWSCSWCGGGASDEQGLLDHQEWCLGDARANTQLLSEVATREGELTQEALVAAARQRRLAAETKLPND